MLLLHSTFQNQYGNPHITTVTHPDVREGSGVHRSPAHSLHRRYRALRPCAARCDLRVASRRPQPARVTALAHASVGRTHGIGQVSTFYEVHQLLGLRVQDQWLSSAASFKVTVLKRI
eukprot:6199546-Pleurochrysis_carterae.AAC.3